VSPVQPQEAHSDNGTEYINARVAGLLEKMRVDFIRSRPRHSNDNGLAETKNGAILRKHLGYSHIPQHLAEEVNDFFSEYLNPYLNFHRPCLFPEEIQQMVMTPLEKLLSLEECERYLKKDVTQKSLLEKANGCSDNEAAARMAAAKRKLFESVSRQSRTTG